MASRSLEQIIHSCLNLNQQLLEFAIECRKKTGELSDSDFAKDEAGKNLLYYFQRHQESTIRGISEILEHIPPSFKNRWFDLYPVEYEKRIQETMKALNDKSLAAQLDTIFQAKRTILKIYQTCLEESDIPEINDIFAQITQHETKEFELFSRRVSEFEQEFRQVI